MFPVEILKKFIESGYEEKDLSTVKAAASVSQQWNAISRPYVFRRVTLHDENMLDRLLALLSQNQTIRPLIHTLVIQPRGEDGLMLLEPSPWIGRVPFNLAPYLLNLEAIELSQVLERGRHINAACVTEFANFTSVHTLTFRNTSLDLALIEALVSALPNVQNLILFHVSTLELEYGVELPRLQRSPRLKFVELHFSYIHITGMDTFLSWLMETETMQTLRSLSATVRLQGGETFGRFLALVGGQLERLTLDLDIYFGFPDEMNSVKRKFDVGSCVNLRELQIFYGDESMTNAINATFAEIQSPYIHTINIAMSGGSDSVDILPTLAPLDQAFSKGVLGAPNLKVVRVRYGGMMTLEAVLQKAQRELPTAHARGLLRADRWY